MWIFGLVRASGPLSHFLQPGDYNDGGKNTGERLVHPAERRAGIKHLQERKKLHTEQ